MEKNNSHPFLVSKTAYVYLLRKGTQDIAVTINLAVAETVYLNLVAWSQARKIGPSLYIIVLVLGSYILLAVKIDSSSTLVDSIACELNMGS